MKRLYTFVLIFLVPFVSLAQRTADIGFATGVTNYLGDLGNEKIFPLSSANTGATVTFRNFLNNPKNSGTNFRTIDMQLRFSWHRLQYDETNSIGNKKGNELRNYLRGLNFRNDIFGSEVDFTYNIYPNRYAPLNKPRFNFFLSFGIGAFYGIPRADLFKGETALANRYYFWNDGTVRNAPENDKLIGEEISKDGV